MRYLVTTVQYGCPVRPRAFVSAAAALHEAGWARGGLDASGRLAEVEGLAHGQAIQLPNGLTGAVTTLRAIDVDRAPASTRPIAVEVWAVEMMRACGLAGWRFAWDNAKRRCGSCCSGTRTITLSKHYARLNTPEQLRDTLIHEIAHALVGAAHGHDATWARMARELGHSGARYNATAQMPQGGWRGLCLCTDVDHRWHRQPKVARRCLKCRQLLTYVRV